MRPTRLLLFLSLAAFLVSVLVIVVGQVSAAFALLIWGVLGVAVLIDIARSRPRGRLSLDIDMPEEAFSGEDSPATLLCWRGKLGLIEFIPSLPLDRSILIVPNIRPISSGNIDVMIRSNLFGVKENAMQGEGSDFHQLRDFTTGMDVRSIDWKRSASHRSLVAKETRAERNHHVILALDNGYLMREEIAGLPKIDHQINNALALAWAAVQGGDQIGMFAFDVKPRFFAPPESGRSAFSRLRSRAGELEYRSVETNHTLAAAFLQARLKRRSLIIIFSDFVDTTTAELLLENVSVLNKRHLIVFATLGDPEMVAITRARPDNLTEVARLVSAEQFLQERRLVLDRLSRLGVMCIEAGPKQMMASLISTYLQIKAREMI